VRPAGDAMYGMPQNSHDARSNMLNIHCHVHPVYGRRHKCKENIEGNYHFEDVGVNWKILLKWLFKN
jgi:hypothetical protein